jgi:thymidylate synthase (FAD)
MAHETRMEVYPVAGPMMYWSEVSRFLNSIGGTQWIDQVYQNHPGWSRGLDAVERPNDAHHLIEFMGRLCYQSWAPGINPNVTRVRTDQEQYLQNLVTSLHGSVTSHAQFSFVFSNVSRVLTEELSRHEIGAHLNAALPPTDARSQESLRYVRITDLGIYVPDVFDDDDKAMFISIVENVEDFVKSRSEKYDLDKSKDFEFKKKMTSALRRAAPMGMTTHVGWSGNIRTIRHCLEARTAPGVEEEMRKTFGRLGEWMLILAPMMFSDYKVVDGHWTTDYRKI